ncbi:hypothetical protein F4775DRAFT_588394 [Biscogniauxia sp. FL1348]|nr:hypothetical protein F4775DRAFT_588394 [Biscogniauxia sp. FL1348]
MLANLKTQVLASLLLASSLVSGATIQNLLPEPVSEGDVKVYTVNQGNTHGRVIIGGGGGGSHKVPVSATAGSVSDNACFIETGEFPRSTFKRPEADQCFNMAAFHKLKIWRAAKCEDGSAAMLARYDAPGCGGEPAMLDAVADDMIRTCLDMPTKEPASYAFWCSGEIKEPGVKEAAAASDVDSGNGDGNGSGSRKKGGLGTFVLVLSVFGLLGLMMLVITIYRLLKMSQWFLSLFNKNGITLN